MKAAVAGAAGLALSAGPEAQSAGQTIYNGIRLASPWPPDRRSFPDRAITPPYLVNPPDVIAIDVGRQLFVDDFLSLQDLVILLMKFFCSLIELVVHRHKLFILNADFLVHSGVVPRRAASAGFEGDAGFGSGRAMGSSRTGWCPEVIGQRSRRA